MTVPVSVLEHADFGKPLGDEVVVSVDPGAGDGPGDFGQEFDLEDDGLPRFYRPGEFHGENGPVVGIFVVRQFECHGGEEIDFLEAILIDEFDGIDPAVSPIFHFEIQCATSSPAALDKVSAHVVLEGVQVEMKPQLLCGVFGGVGPGQDLISGYGISQCIEHYIHGVAGDLLTKRFISRKEKCCEKENQDRSHGPYFFRQFCLLDP